ncbi:hypothetical protein DMC25_23635 [Caulobacter sp. D4A]|uniref:hypothetical protein n=1 Tax=unclassified Caulobacter TaxID=2648921 RepID=UPI000D72C292|nr:MULTISPECIES: hypothetical protein [unclassified Caulobacter]PXA76943.1 hypothetical protein DMC25_23635 [Caulobacter sp. D4A]PXA88830.1 hypothetical protein DMC18_18365 [Caulobacter sp. D5]
MRTTVILLAAASLAAVAAPALAAERLTDSQFVRANRCLGLTEAKALGETDAAPLKALIKAQRQGRHISIEDRADAARLSAKREASRAEGDAKSALVGERDGDCKSLAQS